MTNFIDALQDKINELEEEKEHIDEKIELLKELMESEDSKIVALPSVKRRAGRPKGSKNKRSKKPSSDHAPLDELYEEALVELEKREGGGTSPELQKKLGTGFKPAPRPSRKLGVGVTAGTKKHIEEVASSRKPDAVVSIDEGE